jgi:SAM-dependent methyltransferase
MRPAAAIRSTSFGQNHQPSLADRLGVWLSLREISRHSGSLADKHFGDFGCGYNATIASQLLASAAKATLVDVALAPHLKQHPSVNAVEGPLPEAIAGVASGSLDLALCTSVLEHLDEPLATLVEIHRVLKMGGVCMINVPSWRGKRFLEFSAFRLGMSPAEEMNDHKMYYDVRDLWPMLVKAGFAPQNIQCYPAKLGLTTFAVCRTGRP